MNNIVDFLAQRIDNRENLLLMVAGHMLDDKHPDRTSIVDKISKVVSDGKEVLSEDKFALFKFKTMYTIKIIPEEKDSEGRLSPILCHFDLEKVKSSNKSLVKAVVSEINCFLKEIKRTINDQTKREIEEALNKETARKGRWSKLSKLKDKASSFTHRANMPSYDNSAKDRLIEKLDYEIWLLDYLSKTQDLFQGGTDISTIRFNNKVLTRDVRIQEHVGADHIIQIVDSLTPLVFTSSFKVLDMIFEWILEENRNSGIISKVPWRFCEKISLISSTNLKYPPLFISNPYLKKYTFAFFNNLLPYRNAIVHNHNFKISKEKITLFDCKSNNKLVLDRIQLGYLVRIVVETAKALSGKLNFDKFVDSILKYYLDRLTTIHNQASFGQNYPILLNIELAVQKEGDIFHVDLKFVRETIQKMHPSSDVFFNLTIIGKEGERQLVKWYFPSENVPHNDILSLKYDSYPEFLKK